MKKIFPVVLASCFVVACNGGGGSSSNGDNPSPTPVTNPDATQRHLDLQPIKFEQYVEDSNGAMVQGIPNLKVGGHQFWYLKITNPNTESIEFIQTPEECDSVIGGCAFTDYNGKTRVRSNLLTERFESEQLFSKDGIKPMGIDNPATTMYQSGIVSGLSKSSALVDGRRFASPDYIDHVNGLNDRSKYVNKTGLPFCYEYNGGTGGDSDNVKPIALAPNQSCIIRYNAEFKGTNFSESDLLKFSFDYAYKVVGNGYDVNENTPKQYGSYAYQYQNQVQAFYFSTNSKDVCNRQKGIVKQYKSDFIFKAVPDSYDNRTEQHVDIQTSCHDNGDGSPVLYVREQNLKLSNQNISMYDYVWKEYFTKPLGVANVGYSLGTQFFGGFVLGSSTMSPVYNKNGDTWIWGEEYGRSMYGISMAYNSANNTLAAPVYNRLATDNRNPTQIGDTTDPYGELHGFDYKHQALALSDNGRYMYEDGVYRELYKVNGVYYTSESRPIAPFTRSTYAKSSSFDGVTEVRSAYALGGNGKFYYSICYFTGHNKTELTNQDENWCYVYRMNNNTNDVPSATLISKFYLDPNSAMAKPFNFKNLGGNGGLILTAVTADESKFAFAANVGSVYDINLSVACGVKNQTPNQYVDVPEQVNLTRYGSPTWINGQLFAPYYSSHYDSSGNVTWDFDSLVKFDMTSCSIDKNSYLVNVAQNLKTNNTYAIYGIQYDINRSAPLPLSAISNGYSGQ